MLNSTAILTASISLDLLFMGTFLLEDYCGELQMNLDGANSYRGDPK